MIVGKAGGEGPQPAGGSGPRVSLWGCPGGRRGRRSPVVCVGSGGHARSLTLGAEGRTAPPVAWAVAWAVAWLCTQYGSALCGSPTHPHAPHTHTGTHAHDRALSLVGGGLYGCRVRTQGTQPSPWGQCEDTARPAEAAAALPSTCDPDVGHTPRLRS